MRERINYRMYECYTNYRKLFFNTITKWINNCTGFLKFCYMIVRDTNYFTSLCIDKAVLIKLEEDYSDEAVMEEAVYTVISDHLDKSGYGIGNWFIAQCEGKWTVGELTDIDPDDITILDWYKKEYFKLHVDDIDFAMTVSREEYDRILHSSAEEYYKYLFIHKRFTRNFYLYNRRENEKILIATLGDMYFDLKKEESNEAIEWACSLCLDKIECEDISVEEILENINKVREQKEIDSKKKHDAAIYEAIYKNIKENDDIDTARKYSLEAKSSPGGDSFQEIWDYIKNFWDNHPHLIEDAYFAKFHKPML